MTTLTKARSYPLAATSSLDGSCADSYPADINRGLSMVVNAAIAVYFLLNAASMVFLLATRHPAAWQWVAAATIDRDTRNVWRFGCGLLGCLSALTLSAAVLL